MEPIPEEVVVETWQEAARFTPGQTNKEMGKLAKNQPDLLTFMMEFTEEVRQNRKLRVVWE